MLSNRVKKLLFSIILLLVVGAAIGGGIYSLQNPATRLLLGLEPPASPEVSTPRYSSIPTVLGATTSTPQISYDKLYSLINGYRRENRVTALKAHMALEQSAAAKLRDMKEHHYWTHIDPQGRESWYLFDQIGYHFQKAGENLSFGYTTEWKVFEEWTKSPEHNAQLLDPDYEHMGLAVDCDSYVQPKKKTCIVVLHLGKQKL